MSLKCDSSSLLTCCVLAAKAPACCFLVPYPLALAPTLWIITWHEHKPIAVHAGAAVLMHIHHPAAHHREYHTV